ncbi:Response regulator containing a CheY-like receiver domain and an HTH DNA-binding domain [Dulcicalothrix desertica PCC 7102]|nr:Response regulator containing a CheY-like receiver domain and an HTH DNA-binding domain [Dulcicalothrix desertica PCC 7102]
MLSCEPSTLRVLVVDDHELTRMTLQMVLSCQKNMQVVGLATNGQEAVDMVKRHRPDVIVLDLQMPVMDGWTASGKIKEIAPDTQIIAYSSVEDAKNAGANNDMGRWDVFCKKDVPTTELIALVRELGNGNNESAA